MSAQSRTYALLNCIGGLLAGSASCIYGAWPSAASNFLWALIAGVTLVTAVLPKRRIGLTVVETDFSPEPEPEPLLAGISAAA